MSGDRDTTTLVVAHPFALRQVAGTTILLRALLHELAAADAGLRTVYLDIGRETTPAASLSRLRAADRGALQLLGVNLHLDVHADRSLECYELCHREGLLASLWVHDYWPHHEGSVRRLTEELGATLLASTSTVLDALARDGFSARVAQVGISPADLVDGGLRRATTRFAVGSAGRLVRRKRHVDVVRAFEQARLRGAAELRLRLLPSLVYPEAADEEQFDEVMRAVAAVRASGGTVVVDRRAAARHDYGAYDAYICASDYEGFSMTPIEAVYCGCPAFISDIPAHREIARVLHADAADEMLFPPGDVDTLAELLRDEARTGRRRAHLRERRDEIRSLIEARWSMRRTAQALLDALDLTRERGSSGASRRSG